MDTGSYDELVEKDIEDYKAFVEEMEANMWGCLSWVAVFGLILLLLTLIILK
jgi:hypothetical protein